MINFLLISFGGFTGAICRFIISSLFQLKLTGTLFVNLVGSILLAVTFLFFEKNILPDSLWLMLGIGFCGSYTTFSTFSYEAIELILNERYYQASFYILSSFAISIISVFTIIYSFK